MYNQPKQKKKVRKVVRMPRKMKIFSWYGRPQFAPVKKGTSPCNSEHLPAISEPTHIRSGATTPEQQQTRSRTNTRPTTPINNESTTTSPTTMIKTTVGHIGHIAHLISHPMELIHGEQHPPETSPTTSMAKALSHTGHMIELIDHHRHIEDMSAMHRRLRDEAQAEMDAWLAEGGGLKTIVSLTQSENLEKTADANFHLSITIVYDEV